MGDRSGMSISTDSPSDETLNRGPLALQYEFPFGINIVQFSFFFTTPVPLKTNKLSSPVRVSFPGEFIDVILLQFIRHI